MSSLTLSRHTSAAPSPKLTPILLNPIKPASAPSSGSSRGGFQFTLAPPRPALSSNGGSLISSAASTSSTSSSSNNDHAGASLSPSLSEAHRTSSARKIQFAPLPDPRSLEEAEANAEEDDEGEDVCYPDPDDSLHRRTSISSLNGSQNGVPMIRINSRGNDSRLTGSTASLEGTATGTSNSGSWSKRLLNPLKVVSMINPSKEDFVYIDDDTNDHRDASGSLYRTDSVDSQHSTRSAATCQSDDSRLGRKRSSLFARMAPLTHSLSDSGGVGFSGRKKKKARSSSSGAASSSQNGGGGHSWFSGNPRSESGNVRPTAPMARNSSAPASSSSSSATTSSGNPRTGKRNGPMVMLNGRVYGAKRGGAPKAVDHFKNQRAPGWNEQEFVEWGAGGLGSVPTNRASGAAADWDRVRGGGIATAAEDEDDGSGIGWVKRRREQRERERKEREEREKLEAERASSSASSSSADGDANQTESQNALDTAAAAGAVSGGASSSLPSSDASAAGSSAPSSPLALSMSTIATTPSSSVPSSPTTTVLTPTASSPYKDRIPHQPFASPSSELEAFIGSRDKDKENHHTEMAAVPPRASHVHAHDRYRSNSRKVSVDRESTVSSAGGSASGKSLSTPPRPGSSSTLRPGDSVLMKRQDSETSELSLDGSDSNDGSREAEDDDEDEEEEEEDEGLTEAQMRLTAQVAGLEKVSRHRNRDSVHSVLSSPIVDKAP